MNRHILITHPTFGENVAVYTTGEMAEVYRTHTTIGARHLADLDAGKAVFIGGSLHVDMVASARAVTEAELEA